MGHNTIHRVALRALHGFSAQIPVWLLTIGLLVSGCQKKSESPTPDAVAWVGERPVLAAALESELKRQSMGGMAADKEKVMGELVEL